MPRTIAIVVSSMQTGGAERVASHLANAWAARGDAVRLIATYSGHGYCFVPLSSRVELIYLADLLGKGTGRGAKGYWNRFWALRRHIRDLRADLIISFLTNVNVATLLVTAGLKPPIFVCERTYPPARHTDWLLATLRRITYPWATGVVMLTQEGIRWLNARVPGARGAVIPNPVLLPLPTTEPMLRPEQFVSSERRLLLAVGRLDKGKQFDQLLDAFAALAPQHPSWDLVILGEGPEGPQLKQRTTMLNIGQRVRLPGRAGNIGDWYRRADLFAMTSRYEGFPNTLAEAMAHGCTAVSYDCDTGPRDIIRHEQDGLLVSPVGDVRRLTHALGRLMGSDTERTRMGQRAIEVRERYSLEKVLAMWDRLFDVSAAE